MDDADDDLLAGRYRLGDVLGQGGMGAVYAAHDLRLDRAVAVKLLLPQLAAQPPLRRRFESEARLAARLSHPNVVAVHDVGEGSDGTPFIVMERMGGRSLADEIDQGPLAVDRVREIGQQVLAAVDAAHRAGVLHRDLKPANVLFDEHGRPKVTDFGIAKAIGEVDQTQTSAGTLLGTLGYLAPERLAGEPAAPVSDQWSVGVMLYQALAGHRPFSGTAPAALAADIAAHPRPDVSRERPEIDPALAYAIGRALSPRPQERFASAAEMAAALEPGAVAPLAATVAHPAPVPVAGQPTRPYPAGRPSVPDTTASPRRRRRGLAALLAVAVAAGIAVIALLALNGGSGGGGPTTATSGSVPSTAAPSTSIEPTTASSTTASSTTAATTAAPTTTEPTTSTTIPTTKPGKPGKPKGPKDSKPQGDKDSG